ncbi:hypothetical protein BH23CYA1_BH23CYA1_05200 [soil metagenome]
MAASAKVSRQPREHSQLTLWSVAVISFLLGSAATALVIWQLHKLYQATIAPLVEVEGVVKAQYGYQASDSPTPPPSGYYIEASGIGRVYLTDKPLDPFVGQSVSAAGSVSGTCGPKSIPCFPLLTVREIRKLEAAE